MTPPARPDPVAALMHYANQALGQCTGTHIAGMGDCQMVSRVISERGYVLVNADMLAAALRLELNRPHSAGQYEELAAAILAALKGPAR